MMSRRRWLAVLAAGAALPLSNMARTNAAGPNILQPSNAGDDAFIARAFEMRDLAVRNGDQGFGAVVVKDGVIVAEMPSRVVSINDSTAHAELEAIREAARRLGRDELRGAVLYSSFKPCPMCETAAYWAGIEKFYFGRPISGGARPSLPNC